MRRCVVWARPTGPWLTLKSRLAARLTTTHGDDDRDGVDSLNQPAKLTDEVTAICLLPAGSALYFRSTGAVREEQFRRAIPWLIGAVRRESSNYWYQYLLAYIEDKAGDIDAALNHYSVAWALRPDLPQVQFSRARLYRSKGRWDLAIEDLKGAEQAKRPARGQLGSTGARVCLL